MPNRLRLFDVRSSDFAQVLGICQSDQAQVARKLNRAQEQLIYAKEAGEDSWYGTWAEIAFTVSRSNPYITLPREVARLEAVTVCDRVVKVQMQQFEYLEFGNGRLPKLNRWDRRNCLTAVYSRNNVPTFTDLSTATPQFIRVYYTDPADLNGARVLIQGTDASDNVIYSQAGFDQVQGIYVTLQSPFAVTPFTVKTITGIQKDVTHGPVQIYQVDPATGAQVLLLTMESTEQVANYRRYYFDSLPRHCCPSPSAADSVTVTALAKLELIPVIADTDYCLIQSLTALIHEAKAIRYSDCDEKNAKAMAQEAHMQAVRVLSGQLGHYVGINEPAVIFAPFGSAKLTRQRIGQI